MGLFSKKKEPVKMNSSFNSLISMNSPSVPPPPSQFRGDIDTSRNIFDLQQPQFPQSRMMPEHPTTAPHIPTPPVHDDYSDSMFMQGARTTKQSEMSGMQEGDDFHLPDFEESDLKELSQMSIKEKMQPLVEPTPPRKMFVQKEELKLLPPERQIQVRQSSDMMLSQSFIETKSTDKYLDMRVFFSVKEKIAESKTVARLSEESMAEQHYRLRAEDYDSLTRTLNDVQQKLMLIENKLFDGNNPEVN